jgi:1-phosphatidylinositol-4-phosphate 5-kinase
MRYTNGDIYEGNWENGAKKGTGKYVFADKSVYEGNWDQDEK